MGSKIKPKKRHVELVVISDVHLGTYGCQAKALNAYLKSITCDTLILNGDIIDGWQFSKRYFPKSHMKIWKRVTEKIAEGVKVYYLTGNHDEFLRRFSGFQMGDFYLEDKLVLELDGKKAWFFHGDVFDVTMQHSKWLAKLGAVGYDTLILINTFTNWILRKLGRGRISLSKKVKDKVKGAVKFINNFEKTASDIAIRNGYDYVVCGHIHQPEIREINTETGNVVYLNSGDWIENLSALEYHKGTWSLYKTPKDHIFKQKEELEEGEEELDTKVLFRELVKEFHA